MIVYFDIDSTLFTTALFMKTRINEQLVEVLGVSSEQLQQASDAYYQTIEKGTDFNYHDYAAFLADYFSDVGGRGNVAQIEGLFETQSLYEGMVYPEVASVLQTLRERGVVMGIYSEGFTDLQTNKLQYTGILEYFDSNHIHMSRRKKQIEVLQKLETPSLFIDDKLEYLQDLPDGIKPILIDRESTQTQTHEGVVSIQSLEEIFNFLDN